MTDKRKVKSKEMGSVINPVTYKPNNVVPNQVHYDIPSNTVPGIKLPNMFGFFGTIVKESK